MNLYRTIRLLSAIYFIVYPLLPSYLIFDLDYCVPFRLASVNLFFLFFFVFLIHWKKRPFKKAIKNFSTGYRFWKINWPQKPTKFKICAPNATGVHIRGDFNAWRMQELRQDAINKSQWSIELKLRNGEYGYLFCIDRECKLDPNAVKTKMTPEGKRCSVKTVSDTSQSPKVRVDIRTNFVRSLIIVAGFVLAFISKNDLLYFSNIITLTVISIASGLIYSFVFSGSFKSSNKSGDNLIVSNIHENTMEICLNVQVVLLIIALTLLKY